MANRIMSAMKLYLVICLSVFISHFCFSNETIVMELDDQMTVKSESSELTVTIETIDGRLHIMISGKDRVDGKLINKFIFEADRGVLETTTVELDGKLIETVDSNADGQADYRLIYNTKTSEQRIEELKTVVKDGETTSRDEKEDMPCGTSKKTKK